RKSSGIWDARDEKVKKFQLIDKLAGNVVFYGRAPSTTDGSHAWCIAGERSSRGVSQRAACKGGSGMVEKWHDTAAYFLCTPGLYEHMMTPRRSRSGQYRVETDHEQGRRQRL